MSDVVENILCPIYWVRCDGCEKSHDTASTAVTEQQADEFAVLDGWTIAAMDRHYCPECSLVMEACS